MCLVGLAGQLDMHSQIPPDILLATGSLEAMEAQCSEDGEFSDGLRSSVWCCLVARGVARLHA